MVSFLDYKFSVSPNFVEEIQNAFKKFDWFDDFVLVDQNGDITLFDISDGNTEDAISQVIGELSPEALATVTCNIIVCECCGVSKFSVVDGKIVQKHAVDFVWND